MTHQRLTLTLIACIALSLLAGRALSASGEIGVELNKLETHAPDCRVYLVFDNGAGPPLEVLQLDLILFDHDGLIMRRLAVDSAPLRAAKTTVKFFDIPGLDCDAIARILLNDVLDCQDQTGPLEDCVERLNPSSRAAAALVK